MDQIPNISWASLFSCAHLIGGVRNWNTNILLSHWSCWPQLNTILRVSALRLIENSWTSYQPRVLTGVVGGIF